MAKVGLKDTLALIAKGYSKKEIDELAAMDEQAAQEAVKDAEENKPEEKPAEEKREEEPDYKEMYKALLKEKEEADKKVKDLQQENVHKNSAPLAEEAKKAQQESLVNLVRGYM